MDKQVIARIFICTGYYGSRTKDGGIVHREFLGEGDVRVRDLVGVGEEGGRVWAERPVWGEKSMEGISEYV